MWIYADPDLVSETLVFHELASRANGGVHVDPDPVSEILYIMYLTRADGSIHADPDSVSETRVFPALSLGLIVLYYTVLLNRHIPDVQISKH
jgi:hypothetical protein